jgi:hypothetical protein
MLQLNSAACQSRPHTSCLASVETTPSPSPLRTQPVHLFGVDRHPGRQPRARCHRPKLLSNQDHFDFGAKEAFNTFAKGAERLMNAQTEAGHAEFLRQVGSATHHLQDQYALGHILPGSSLFKDFWGAPARFIVHNVIGGEVTFRHASYEATRDFLALMHPTSA